MAWTGENYYYDEAVENLLKVYQIPESEVTPASGEKWLDDLKESMNKDSDSSTVHVVEIENNALEDGVEWAIQLPSLKRIQVVNNGFGGKFLEIRQYQKMNEGELEGSRSKFIRLTKVCCGDYYASISKYIILPRQ